MTSVPPPSAPAGDALSVLPARFRAEKPLGRGSQRSVYLARDTEQDRWVAVSVFEASTLSESDLERFGQVHALAGSGAHPHVVPIELIFEVSGNVVTISPFMTGGDLAGELQARDHKPLPLTDTLRIGSHVCRALESIHAAGITHCDVKPGNILLDENGDAHLGDFGLAVPTTVGAQFGIAGTPAYIAPEQIASPPGGVGADLYSFGCVLYELTTGRPPFVGLPVSDVLLQHHALRPVPPVDRNPAIPCVLSDLILKLLEKQPSARPACAADVGAALEGMLRGPGVSATPDSLSGLPHRQRLALELPLVGRAREIEALEEALERDTGSSPGLLLFSGEAGSGKSRLVAMSRERAQTCGYTVLNGAGDELRMESYRPFTDALAPLAGHLSDLAPMHAELLRDFLYRGQDADRLDRLTPRGAERDRLSAAVFALLSAAANQRRLVLVIEDLHAVDDSSLGLLEDFTATLFEGAPRRATALLIVASTRPPVDERRRSLLARLRGDLACQSFELAPLEEPAIFEMLAALGGGRRPSGQLCRKVVKATDGNPLFVREAVHRLLDAGLFETGIVPSAEPWDIDFELPSSVGSAIAERIERLGSGCRELLALATLLASRFARTRLSAVWDRGEEEFEEALGEAVAQGLIAEDGVAYAFAHPLIRQAARDGMDPRERQRLHFRIARHLITLTPSSDVDVIEVAYHLVRSGAQADPTELARIASQAAQEALARFAWHEGAELLEAAIEAANHGAELSVLQLAELHRNAGLAYWRLMDAKPSLNHYDAAIAGFERAGDALGLARAMNDRAVAGLLRLTSYGHLEEIEPLERALERLDPSEITLRAQILRTLSECYWAARQTARAEQLGVETLALAKQCSDHHLCAEASIDLGMARFLSLRVEEALSTWQAGAAHAQHAQDLVSEQRCLVRSSIALTATARLAEAREMVRKVRENYYLVQLQGEMSTASAVQVALATLAGEYEAADSHAAEALERARRVAYPWGAILCLPALACARALRNDVAGASRAIRLLFEPGTGFADSSAFAALGQGCEWLAHWYAGDVPAIDVREAKSVLIEPGGLVDQNAGTLACAAVEIADALQEPDLAESAIGLLEIAQRHGFVFWCGWPFFLPRLRGVAAALTGRFDLAEEQLVSAIAIAERVGVEIELARSQLDLARMLATRNSGNDRAHARDLVETCRRTLRKRGPAVFVERSDRLHAFLGG